MTIKQLIEKLKQFPEDAVVATFDDINWAAKDDPDWIKITERTWVHNNYPYDKPDFKYINLE